MEPFASDDMYGPLVAIFFIVLVIIGKYLLVNLLVAVILTEFGNSEVSSSGASDGGSNNTTNRSDTQRSARVAFASGTDRGGTRGKPDVDHPDNNSLFCFGVHNPLRRSCTRLTAHRYFDRLIILVILLSSAGLALESPRLDEGSDLAALLRVSDLVFTAIFTLEMLIKIVAHTFCSGPNAYIRSPWNLLDMTIVCVSLLVLLSEGIPVLANLRILRLLRVLRPLRLISRNAGMRLIITSLFRVMPAIANVIAASTKLKKHTPC